MRAKIVYLTNIDRRFFMMQKALRELQGAGEIGAESACVKTTDATVWDDRFRELVSGASLVLIRFMGNTIRTRFWMACLTYMESRGIPYFLDAPGSAEGERKAAVSEADMAMLREYSFQGGMENYRNLWRYAAALFGDGEKPPAPVVLPWTGIYHPGVTSGKSTAAGNGEKVSGFGFQVSDSASFCCGNQSVQDDMTQKTTGNQKPETRNQPFFPTYASYAKQHILPSRPTIGFLFYRDEWLWDDLHYQAAFVREAERQGYNVIPVFTNGLPDPKLGMPTLSEVFHRFFMKDGKPVVDVIVNCMKFSFTTSGSISTKELKALGVPVLQAYSLLMPQEEWEAAPEGMNPVEVSISAAMPEMDGIIHALPIAAKHVKEDGEVEYLPIAGRMEALIRRAGAWAKLHRKANQDKKIAIIFHNYPPKNSHIGSAFGLDSIESVRRLLLRMKEAGYRVDFVPEDGEQFIKILTANATNDLSMMTEEQERRCQKVPRETYLTFFSHFPKKAQQEMEKDWGKAPGSCMVDDNGNILVPGTMDGSVFITVQAPRGYGFEPEKIYHDPYIAPTHQYLASYEWIRDVWHADAVVHVGTHGNLEWLPGKSVGLDAASYPDLALGSLPNIYPYHMTITGEGIQAKRRGGACLVDHLPAPLADAGTYDELSELDAAMDEYAHFETTQPETAEKLKGKIRSLAQKAELYGEVPYEEGSDFADYLTRLHAYLEEIQVSECHVGLHILGEMPHGEILTNELLQYLRLPNGEVPSIYELLAGKYGMSVEQLEAEAQKLLPMGLTGNELMKKIRGEAEAFIHFLKEQHFTDDAVEKVLEEPYVKDGNPAFQEKVRTLTVYVVHDLVPRLRGTTREVDNILAGLSAKYVEPGASGSPHAGGVSLLPAGLNFYGLDPRKLPTKAAWEIGKQLAEEVIRQFIEDEGHYPENVGMVFWSGANMRSHGQDVAEFLYLMGIRPVWERGSLYVKKLEPIPLAELKRPRIDVTARISGLFRDTMPTVVSLLDQAVLLAASLDEGDTDNFVKHHISTDAEALEKEGMPRKEAWREAAYRIFGDAPGTYGAGVSALLESKNWEKLDDIAKVFIRWGGHAYGGAAKGVYKPERFEKRLAHMDVTVKNEDNHETSMFSSDDYNAYHGGLIAAVRSVSGKAPHSYAGDTTDRSHVKVRTVQEEAKRVFRAESVNPKFIEGMMQHGYKGAADLSSRVAVSFQWDATSGVMEDWMYEKLAEKYALDPKVQNWMKQVNPWALQRIAETLLEARQRGLWDAKEDTVEKVQNLLLEVEGEIEGDE